MSRPAPMSKKGDFAIILDCLNSPNSKGRVVSIQSDAQWILGRTTSVPGIGDVERPDGWGYVIELDARLPLAYELRLRPY